MITIPAGYTAHLIGQSTSLEVAGNFEALEGSKPEGALMLMTLDFEESLSADQVADINNKLISAGVLLWPGNTQIAYMDTTQPTLYICWAKGFVFSSIIIGMLVFMVLPALLSIGLWHLMPESMRQMIEMIVMVGVVMLMMKMMVPALKETTIPAIEETKEKE